MKKRLLVKVINFFAFNLLFFALYLNFIHKDNAPAPVASQSNTATVQGTVLVSNPEAYINKTVKEAIHSASGNHQFSSN